LEIRIVEDAERPAVPRAGKLPLGLPAWFLSNWIPNKDGKSLVRVACRWLAVDDFSRLDSNDDGFLEPQEILSFSPSPSGTVLAIRISLANAAASNAKMR